MHAEILLNCQLVRAFHGYALPNLAYIHSLRFQPEVDPMLKQSAPWHNPEQSTQYWLNSLRQRKIQEIRLDLTGQYALIYTQFADATLSTWRADWQFSELEQQWEICYRESLTRLAQLQRHNMEDNHKEFRELLQKIEGLAARIGETQFAAIFHKAAQTLNQRASTPECRHQQLYVAAQQAWVFGGMGSWNDAAPYLAAEHGLEQDYQQLTAQLHRQITQALMYAVNFPKNTIKDDV